MLAWLHLCCSCLASGRGVRPARRLWSRLDESNSANAAQTKRTTLFIPKTTEWSLFQSTAFPGESNSCGWDNGKAWAELRSQPGLADQGMRIGGMCQSEFVVPLFRQWGLQKKDGPPSTGHHEGNSLLPVSRYDRAQCSLIILREGCLAGCRRRE